MAKKNSKFKHTKPLGVCSFRMPQDLLDDAKRKHLNISLICRKALEREIKGY